MMMAGNRCSGLEIVFCDARAIFHKENLDVAPGETLVSAFHGPMGARFRRFLILEQFNRDVAKWFVGKVAGGVREISRCKSRLAIGEFDLDRGLACDSILDVRIAERDEDVIVAVAVNQRRCVRRYLDLEDAYVFIFEGRVVRWFRSDLDFSCSLRGEKGNQKQRQEKERSASHETGL